MTRGSSTGLTRIAGAVRQHRPARRVLAGPAAVAVTLAAMLAAANGMPGDASAAGTVAFREVTHGSRGFDVPGEAARARGRILRSKSQATALLGAWGVDSSATKSVNFARDSLIVVLAKQQPTGGFRAGVSRVLVRGRQATVSAAVRSEGAETVGQSVTRPWVIVAVKRRTLLRVQNEVRLRLG